MKYLVTYTETLGRSFIVEADSEQKAEEKMWDAVNAEKVVLTADDYICDSSEVNVFGKADSYSLEFCTEL